MKLLRHLGPGVAAAGLLGEFGYSVKCIAKATGLSPGVVRYRLHQRGIRVSDWREGRTPLSKLVIANSKKFAIHQLRAHVQLKIRDQYEKLGFVVDV